MATLATDLRRQLETACVQARDLAETAAQSALQKRAIDAAKAFDHFTKADRDLRNRLRARGRQAGDVRQDKAGAQAIDQLTQELAYEYWHRMLFARFLAENHLLMHPDGVAVSLEECQELAKGEGAPNGFVLAARYASRMLPQIFRTDDVLMEVEFAPEHRIALEKLLAKLPSEVFTASDALGWVYQFWQSKKKDEVNRSEVKIGAAELPAVTQLFTEPYMVQFLLHNSLGAWWAGKKLTAEDAESAETEEELRQKLALPGVTWDYLRFVRGDDGKGGPWRPAAGTFIGWPREAKGIKVLDPCCGSGHFLCAALHHLVPIRMAEEHLSAAEAVDAVLRDNLHGLEIDERCCQIAAFALAFESWKLTGYRALPPLNVACSGIGPQCSAEEWVRLAEESGIPMPRIGREPIKNGLLNLHQLFSQAPTLGSLINPAELPRDLIAADFETIQPYLNSILKAEKADDETRERAIAAAGMVKAAELLAGEYALVITNVPYVGRGKQVDDVKAHLDRHYKDGKADLATAFVLRALELCTARGSIALVTPQSWLFLTTYTKLREKLLKGSTWNLVVRLGSNAFRDMNWWAATTALITISTSQAPDSWLMSGIDVSSDKDQLAKADMLADRVPTPVQVVRQASQLQNPDATVRVSNETTSGYLRDFAGCYQGLTTADDGRWRRQVWEVPRIDERWKRLQIPSQNKGVFAGREDIVDALLITTSDHTGVIRGREAWGNSGVAVDRMGQLSRSIYLGDLFHSLVPVVVAHRPEHHLAVAAFCLSDRFVEAARAANQSVSIDNGYMGKLPFDLAQWQAVAADKYPDGLPEPHSDDPTQWLFHGRPEESNTPLHVGVARLLGYRWPAELDDEMRLSHRARELVQRCDELARYSDGDGIVCIPSLRGEEPAAERLRALLQAAYGKKWSNALLHDLLVATGVRVATSLDDWLRNAFFEQHCKLFHNRPFIWHVWDGRKDGFSCLVNYHKLNYKTLENVAYSYLGDWIKAQAAEAKAGTVGADLRLAAAQDLQQKLKLILTGEPPYDIFVRWKPLADQAIGWHPDLNDGVRMNIRPFVQAGVLRKNPNIKWTKDRGKEPERDQEEYPWFWKGGAFTGERVNDVHLTNAEKLAARR